MRISDWSSDVCSSDLQRAAFLQRVTQPGLGIVIEIVAASLEIGQRACVQRGEAGYVIARQLHQRPRRAGQRSGNRHGASVGIAACSISDTARGATPFASFRSEEHTSELQSLMRLSYAVFCLKKKTKK